MKIFIFLFFSCLLIIADIAAAKDSVFSEEIVLKAIREQYNEAESQKDVFMVLDRELPHELLSVMSAKAIEVEEFTLNGHKFLARVKKKGSAEIYEISGKIEDVLMLPVANHILKPGEIISKEDIDFKEIPESALKNYMVTDIKELIGFTPKGRPLVPNQFIKVSQIGKNNDIRKNEIVTLKYTSGNLSISGKGKSLDDGSNGDRVRVINPQSKKIIEGIVTGPNEVLVEG